MRIEYRRRADNSTRWSLLAALAVALVWSLLAMPGEISGLARPLAQAAARAFAAQGKAPDLDLLYGEMIGRAVLRAFAVWIALAGFAFFRRQELRRSGPALLILLVITNIPDLAVVPMARAKAQRDMVAMATMPLCDVLRRPGPLVGHVVNVEGRFRTDGQGRVWLEDPKCPGVLAVGQDLAKGASQPVRTAPSSGPAGPGVWGRFLGLIVRAPTDPTLYPADEGIRISLKTVSNLHNSP